MHHADPRALVDAQVDSALALLARDVAPVGEPAADLLGPLRALGSRGKRMRAQLLLAAHRAAGGGRDHEAVRLAAALELFQTAALVHDDVLDRSDTRRGLPSAHRSIESVHAALGLEGDAERYGVGGAILAGDLALMACLGEVARATASLDAGVGAAVAARFAAMAGLCTAGQYLDVRLAAEPMGEPHALRTRILAVMRSKTASYTTEAPLALGAALAGLADDAVDAWAAAGVPLGLAFQLRDDLLGVVGSEAQTGKPAGDDLREGKRTLVLTHALALADGAGRAALDRVLGRADAPAGAVAEAVEAVRACGAVEAVEAEIEAFGTQARNALASLGVDGANAAELDALVDAALTRSA